VRRIFYVCSVCLLRHFCFPSCLPACLVATRTHTRTNLTPFLITRCAHTCKRLLTREGIFKTAELGGLDQVRGRLVGALVGTVRGKRKSGSQPPAQGVRGLNGRARTARVILAGDRALWDGAGGGINGDDYQ